MISPTPPRDLGSRNNSGSGGSGQAAVGVVRWMRRSWVRHSAGWIMTCSREGPHPTEGKGYFRSPATSRTSGSFAKPWVRSSESWVRSSISWVFVGSFVGSFVEKRPKCAAIRYISNAYGAYSGTLLPPMCRPALHNPRKCVAGCTIRRANGASGGTCSRNLSVHKRVVISIRYRGRHTSRRGRTRGVCLGEEGWCSREPRAGVGWPLSRPA